MDSTHRWTSEREAQKAQANCEEMVERIKRLLPEAGAAEPLEGLLLSRASAVLGETRPRRNRRQILESQGIALSVLSQALLVCISRKSVRI